MHNFLFLLLPMMALVTSTLAAPDEGAPKERPPVSWVNPQLPPGPGLTHHVLDSTAMGHKVGYVVYLPPSYATSGQKRYPVVFFLHGMGGSESADSAGFSGAVARAVQAGTMPEIIIVFPNGGRSGYRDNVENMIVKELIPLIDREYRTLGNTRSRAAAGFSMGGAGAVRLAFTHPELFGAASSWGGGLGGAQDEVLAQVEKHADVLKKNNFAVLLINGDQDRPDAFAPLAKKLQDVGITHSVEVLAETPHNLKLYYERSGERTMRFLGERLKLENQQPKK